MRPRVRKREVAPFSGPLLLIRNGYVAACRSLRLHVAFVILLDDVSEHPAKSVPLYRLVIGFWIPVGLTVSKDTAHEAVCERWRRVPQRT